MRNLAINNFCQLFSLFRHRGKLMGRRKHKCVNFGRADSRGEGGVECEAHALLIQRFRATRRHQSLLSNRETRPGALQADDRQSSSLFSLFPFLLSLCFPSITCDNRPIATCWYMWYARESLGNDSFWTFFRYHDPSIVCMDIYVKNKTMVLTISRSLTILVPVDEIQRNWFRVGFMDISWS